MPWCIAFLFKFYQFNARNTLHDDTHAFCPPPSSSTFLLFSLPTPSAHPEASPSPAVSLLTLPLCALSIIDDPTQRVTGPREMSRQFLYLFTSPSSSTVRSRSLCASSLELQTLIGLYRRSSGRQAVQRPLLHP